MSDEKSRKPSATQQRQKDRRLWLYSFQSITSQVTRGALSPRSKESSFKGVSSPYIDRITSEFDFSSMRAAQIGKQYAKKALSALSLKDKITQNRLQLWSCQIVGYWAKWRTSTRSVMRTEKLLFSRYEKGNTSPSLKRKIRLLYDFLHSTFENSFK